MFPVQVERTLPARFPPSVLSIINCVVSSDDRVTILGESSKGCLGAGHALPRQIHVIDEGMYVFQFYLTIHYIFIFIMMFFQQNSLPVEYRFLMPVLIFAHSVAPGNSVTPFHNCCALLSIFFISDIKITSQPLPCPM